VFIRKTKIMDPIYTYFRQNIETVSKEELLEALWSALESAHHWREACLLGFSAVQVGRANIDLSSKEGQTA